MSAQGRVKFQFQAPNCTSPPANDDFANAELISGASGSAGPVIISCATTEVGEPSGTNLHLVAAQTVWFDWIAPANGTVTIDTHRSTAFPPGNINYSDAFGALDTTLAVWTGATLGTLVEVASNDDVDQSGADVHWWSLVTFAAAMGTTYRIQVGTYTTGPGIFTYFGQVILDWSLV